MTKDDKEVCGFELTSTYLVSNTTAGTVRSSFEDCGFWKYTYTPVDLFLTGFRLKVQPDQGVLDDVGATSLRFRYRTADGSVSSLKAPGGGSGTWSGWSQNCQVGSAVCAIQTRKQDCCNADETSINDVRFECCEF